jgi:hypothetical protein
MTPKAVSVEDGDDALQARDADFVAAALAALPEGTIAAVDGAADGPDRHVPILAGFRLQHR